MDLNDRVATASFLGTLQAGFTDFHYLRPIWKHTTEKDALIGVGMTGIGSNKISEFDLKHASYVVKEINEKLAKVIGINPAARTTTIKPSGTTSCVLGTSSGIHAWHNNYYIRRIRVMKNDPLYVYLTINNPELVEDDKLRSHDTAIISIPQKAPEGSIIRTESALDLLERVKKFNLEWVRSGHRKGANTNNVSATVSIKSEIITGIDINDLSKIDKIKISEWKLVGEWMWNNKDTFNGLSVLPFDNGSYVQAPFEDCSKETYDNLMLKLKDIDLSKVIEIDDNTDLQGELACVGGNCEIK